MISRVEEANSSINKFKSELMLLINANFLIIWKEILEEVVNWDHKINKKEEVDIDKILTFDSKRLELIRKIQLIREERNTILKKTLLMK